MMIRNSISAFVVSVVCLLPLAVHPPVAYAMGSGFAIRAGLARMDGQGTIAIYKDTTTIPYVTKTANPNYYFGVAAAATSQALPCHAVLYIPKHNAILGGGDDVGDALLASKPYSVVTTQDVDTPVCSSFLRLDDGDLPGQYIVELYIADKLQQRVVFNVRPK